MNKYQNLQSTQLLKYDLMLIVYHKAVPFIVLIETDIYVESRNQPSEKKTTEKFNILTFTSSYDRKATTLSSGSFITKLATFFSLCKDKTESFTSDSSYLVKYCPNSKLK